MLAASCLETTMMTGRGEQGSGTVPEPVYITLACSRSSAVLCELLQPALGRSIFFCTSLLRLD